MNAIFVDHSILSTFACCHEKARLAYVEHLKPELEGPPLVFGSAFHAAVAAYYNHRASTNYARQAIDVARKEARHAFLDAVRSAGADALPLSADSDEKRSVERGLYLVDAYITKWQEFDINWVDVFRPDTGAPYIEIGFAVYFMEWRGKPVVLVGKIDRIRRNRVDDRLYNWETKTTGSNVTHFAQSRRPNHQLTGYAWACRELLHLDIAGTILDVIYVSDRKIGGKFPNGIDIEKDFGRFETRRSPTDIDEFLYDLKLVTESFLRLRDEKQRRWHRNAPAACGMYGGCHFREICESNLNSVVIKSKYKIERWEPWKGLSMKSLSIPPD